MKPYNSEIIKLMAAHSDECAAYASAMKWDCLRRQKIKDLEEKDISLNCAFCKRFKRIDCSCDNCPLTNGSYCSKFYHSALIAFRDDRDQQAYTEAANNLYYQIRSIIDDFYKAPRKCDSCLHWEMENGGDCGAQPTIRKYRFEDGKKCACWEPVPEPKPEPKKEVFYKIGQRFSDNQQDKYLLAAIAYHKILLIRDDGYHCGSSVDVEAPWAITEKEMSSIKQGCTFTLIEDKK